MRQSIRFCGIILFASFALMACSGNPYSSSARQCADGLVRADHEMDKAQADGLSSSLSLTKAGVLLAAAHAQHEIERYAGCASKVRKARAYIKRARRR
jgi:hypothetical protein